MVLFTKSFEGTAAIDGTNIVSVTHGLGATPFFFAVYYKAKVAASGYAIGDIAKPTAQVAYSWADGTKVYFRNPDANYYVTDATASSAFILINSTNWELVFKAFV